MSRRKRCKKSNENKNKNNTRSSTTKKRAKKLSIAFFAPITTIKYTQALLVCRIILKIKAAYRRGALGGKKRKK